jgi:hypothetical protein
MTQNSTVLENILTQKTTGLDPGEIKFQTVLKRWRIHINISASGRNNKEGYVAMNLAKYVGMDMKKKVIHAFN